MTSEPVLRTSRGRRLQAIDALLRREAAAPALRDLLSRTRRELEEKRAAAVVLISNSRQQISENLGVIASTAQVLADLRDAADETKQRQTELRKILLSPDARFEFVSSSAKGGVGSSQGTRFLEWLDVRENVWDVVSDDQDQPPDPERRISVSRAFLQLPRVILNHLKGGRALQALILLGVAAPRLAAACGSFDRPLQSQGQAQLRRPTLHDGIQSAAMETLGSLAPAPAILQALMAIAALDARDLPQVFSDSKNKLLHDILTGSRTPDPLDEKKLEECLTAMGLTEAQLPSPPIMNKVSQIDSAIRALKIAKQWEGTAPDSPNISSIFEEICQMLHLKATESGVGVFFLLEDLSAPALFCSKVAQSIPPIHFAPSEDWPSRILGSLDSLLSDESIDCNGVLIIWNLISSQNEDEGSSWHAPFLAPLKLPPPQTLLQSLTPLIDDHFSRRIKSRAQETATTLFQSLGGRESSNRALALFDQQVAALLCDCQRKDAKSGKARLFQVIAEALEEAGGAWLRRPASGPPDGENWVVWGSSLNKVREGLLGKSEGSGAYLLNLRSLAGSGDAVTTVALQAASERCYHIWALEALGGREPLVVSQEFPRYPATWIPSAPSPVTFGILLRGCAALQALEGRELQTSSARETLRKEIANRVCQVVGDLGANASVQSVAQLLFDLAFTKILIENRGVGSTQIEKLEKHLRTVHFVESVDRLLYSEQKLKSGATKALNERLVLLLPLFGSTPSDAIVSEWRKQRVLKTPDRIKDLMGPMVTRLPLIPTSKVPARSAARPPPTEPVKQQQSSGDSATRAAIEYTTSALKEMKEGLLPADLKTSAYRNVSNLSSFLFGRVEGLSSRVSEAMMKSRNSPSSLESPPGT